MSAYGIEAVNAYLGVACIPVPELFRGRGLDPARLANLMMSERSIGLPVEDPVTNAVNAAKPIVDALDPAERDRIELLVTSTESGVDLSKSVASYVHRHLGLSPKCRVVEVKQACYAATAAVQLAVGYLASGISPGAKALVIATDVALVDARAEYAEPATGHGAAAVLLGDDPAVLAMDLGAFGNHSYETLDSARPTPEFDIADVDRSLFAYLDCLANSFADYADKVEDADFVDTFDHLVMHTPFVGLVKAAHRKMMRDLRRAAPAEIEADFERRLRPATAYASRVGNLCSGSVYLGLASAIDNAALGGGVRLGLYSYGSGCSAEFFSGVTDPRAAATVRAGRIAERLDARVELTFAEYDLLLKETLRCLVPVRDREVDLARWDEYLDRVPGREPMLVLSHVEDYHRQYEWR
ncbi:hydroxymethylglutaryl-CoA synthase family protein [Saccharothrix longispora]|uniref:hydroxymethylglutaryl-CoA synthase family protein n=1 Tax=Saccharothrix longispora TaxID=33920 RepID=UPI0028FD6917|nr:hydroxymethylglutaryl-CoA synthase [Saccharothrix longispora]MDU0291030.1 hydroxymethylglutaryl-CoA synthase [Saccharothrix longispora]